MLKFDWFSQAPVDFEYKNYILLSYLKEVDESYSIHRLSPYLLWTEKLVSEMKRFEKIEWEFKQTLWSPIVSLDFRGIKRKEIGVNGEFKEILEVVNYSIPLLESKVNLGYKLLDKYPQILY